MLYHDSATQDENGNWVIDKNFALPAIYHTLFFGPSPSFLDNPAVWCLNNMSSNQNDVGKDKNCQNWINIGANYPTFTWDADQSRAVIKQLHTQRQLGVEELPTDGDGNFVMDTLGNQVIKFADNKFFYQRFDNVSIATDGLGYTLKAPRNYGLSHATSGLFLDGIYGQKEGVIADSTTDMIELTDDASFQNTLLNKLGFRLSDLIVPYGNSTNLHTPSLNGDFSKANRYKQVKPLTTNASFNIADQPDFSLQDNSISNKSGAGYPRYQLSYPPFGTEFNIDGSTSTEIVATDLPTKMDNAYYQIYCDVVPSEFYSQGHKLNATGVVLKNYISGDYVYGFGSDYQLPVMFPRKMTSIVTEIRTPSGRLAAIDPKSSVIYKVIRTLPVINENPEKSK